MAYNIGEKSGKEGYLCPHCGYRAGEITTIARRDETPSTIVSAPRMRQTTYTVKSLRTDFARLRSVTLTLFLAGLMFASGFATKALLSTEESIESPRGSSANLNSGNSSPSVDPGNVGSSSAAPSVSIGNPNVTVWVNTNSGVYHCSNTRWYGNTKSGQYMTQQEAQSKGYRPAHGSACG